MEDLKIIVYALSILGCIALVVLGATGSQENWYENPYFDHYLIPAIAGFAVFPVINTVICIGFGLHIFARIQKRKAHDEARRQKDLARQSRQQSAGHVRYTWHEDD